MEPEPKHARHAVSTPTLSLTYATAVRLTADKTITVDLAADDTIDTVKEQINAIEGIPAERVRLFKGARSLDDGINNIGVETVLQANIVPVCRPELRIEFVLNVIMFSSERYSIQVKVDDTIGKVMHEMWARAGLVPEMQTMVFKGQVLPRAARLCEYVIEKDPNVYLAVQQLGTFTVYSMTTGENFMMEVDVQDTVRSVKRKLQDQEGTPAVRIKLYFLSKEALFLTSPELDDARTLNSYRIETTSKLHAWFERES